MKHAVFRRRLTLLLILCTLVPLFTVGYFYLRQVWTHQTDEVISETRSQLNTSTEQVTKQIDAIYTHLQLMRQNSYLYDLLNMNLETNTSDFFSTSHHVVDVIKAMEASENRTIHIYSYNNLSYEGMFLRDISELPSSLITAVLAGKTPLREAHLPTASSGQETGEFIIYDTIWGVSAPLAIIEYRLPFESIAQAFRFSIPKNSVILYETEQGHSVMIHHSFDKKEEALNWVQHRDPNASGKYYVIEKPLNWGTDRIIALVPSSYVYGKLQNFILALIAITLVILLLILSLTIYISRQMTRRLYHLVLSMNTDVDQWLKQEPTQVQGNDEFSRIASKFYDMAARIKEYYHRDAESEKENKSLQLQLLQERINPHFLYNTLSSLRWAFPNERLESIILSMAKYYRIALNEGHFRIRIEQELEMIREYLNLQRFAYVMEFTYDLQIEPELNDCYILKHLLQPVVENAFLHGIKGLKDQGYILVRVVKRGGQILIQVRDNGKGMTPEKLERILNSEPNEQSEAAGGYGIQNVRRRLELHYGIQHGIHIQSQPGAGTTLTMLIPAESSHAPL
ncbi:sensor histidine kinase [Paenibacillus roseipurpureus]|uniref:histidine kinase n=1 Tax=Paenibacillus roseopurpureus TaxID=2918901 RepID=A0AA96LSJ6_9BACL|nr:histidine kinase [Paenibacillus sp. MBLB1832]WNR45279.1 histidine kinase [Paenibacillus sp. MBLB1832]